MMGADRETGAEFEACMEEKYKETFHFIELEGGHFGSRNRAAYVRCESFPNEKIWVRRMYDDSGNVSYSDNYMAYYYANEITAMIEAVSKEVFSDCKVVFLPQSSEIPLESGPQNSLDELLEDEETIFSVEILADRIAEEEKEEKMELWRQKLEKKKLALEGTVEVKSLDLTCYFCMDTVYEFYYANWR